MNWTKDSNEKPPTREQILEALHKGIVTIDFTKADGSVRTMSATLKTEHLPQNDSQPSEGQWESKDSRWKSPEVISCIDYSLKAWRSFRVDSLLKISA